MDLNPEALARADALMRTGRAAEAAGLYRSLLGGDPRNADLHTALGMAEASQGHRQAAAVCFSEAYELQPEHPGAAANLANALHALGLEQIRQGRAEEAFATFQGLLHLEPEHLDGLLHLGGLFLLQGRNEEAAERLEQAIALDPAFTEALVRLGTLRAQEGDLETAARLYQRALDQDATHAEAHFNLAAILEGEGRLAEAQYHRGRVPRPLPLEIQAAPDPRLRVLVPYGSGTLPFDLLLPRTTTTRILWFAECATDDQEAALPPFDVAFNAIGNADLAGASRDRLARFQARHRLLNPPDKVLATRRDLLPALLEGIPGLHVPRITRLSRFQAQAPDLPARLASLGFTFPLIIRPIVTNGGKGVLRADGPDDLDPAAFPLADAYYVIAFEDYRSPDGCYRKFRMVFVDREPYPYHLAISPNWLVHYFSADMLAEPWKREEERAFMEAPEAFLGAPALRAIRAVGERLDLDYAGLDFSLLPDGRVLVFEANATMLVHLHDPEDLFPYKHAIVPRILEAFQEMLDRAARAGGNSYV